MADVTVPRARAVRLGGSELQRFLVRRVAQAVLVLFCVATVTFFIVRLTGDPVRTMLPPEATQEQEDSLRATLGLDRPLFVQYVSFLWNALHLDFGQSLFFHESAFSVIVDRLPATIQLAVGALVFALVVAIPAGIIAAVKRGSATDSSVVAAVLIGQSTPAFFVGILLILIFAVKLQVLPSAGMGGFDHLILPAITLGLYSMAMIARLLRSSLIDVLGEDYIRTARSKGLSRWLVIRDHGLRNAALPVVTIIGLEIGSLLGGAILTEQVFSWPGVGRLTVEAITNRDFPLMQAIVLFLSVIFVLTNLLVDIAYAFLDPRVRLS
ncbi:ABC transporter permease [Aeromicrobium chenweiae]|uniref:ABC transporter permease n=1 Tax=Aeromicrobium chenweiae TaxID=2079793 RepID=A0A2S0WHP9_9ACTN|nr:ABC transporter permease [Aeromicrobium chenweiae]AWB90853.1 ABC transporter permease [Aeromicrobium chenweiae]TGN31116.1 ABC transporter permease [Aeromicrobium chenweiae]